MIFFFKHIYQHCKKTTIIVNNYLHNYRINYWWRKNSCWRGDFIIPSTTFTFHNNEFTTVVAVSWSVVGELWGGQTHDIRIRDIRCISGEMIPWENQDSQKDILGKSRYPANIRNPDIGFLAQRSQTEITTSQLCAFIEFFGTFILIMFAHFKITYFMRILNKREEV